MTADCLCAGVRIEITGKLGPVVTCHCTQCRKASGSAFAANADVQVAGGSQDPEADPSRA